MSGSLLLLPPQKRKLAMPGIDFMTGFRSPAAAPIASPFVMELGSTVVNLVDTNSAFAVANSMFGVVGTPGANGDGFLSNAALARKAGRALLVCFAQHLGQIPLMGWQVTGTLGNTGIDIGADFANSTSFRAKNGTSAPATETVTSAHHVYVACVMRGTGGFTLVRNGSWGPYLLAWPFHTVSGDAYAKVKYGASSGFGLGYLASIDLSLYDARWGSDYGWATNRIATTANGETTTSLAEAVIEHTITAQTGVTQEIMVRRVDDNNCWIIRMAPPGTDTIKLIEKSGGVETERDSDAVTFVNATQYRVVVTMTASSIRNTVDLSAKNSYSSASIQKTETGVKVSHAGTELVCWPRRMELPLAIERMLRVA